MLRQLHLHDGELALVLLSEVDRLIMVSDLHDFGDWISIQLLVLLLKLRSFFRLWVHETSPDAISVLNYDYEGGPVA